MPDKSGNFQFSYDEVFDSDRPCDQTESLRKYFQDVMPEKNRQEFEQHLSSCESCLKLLTELHETETTAQALVLDAANTDRIYEEGRARFGKETVRTVHPVTTSTFRFSSMMNALMLMLVVILAYPAYRSVVLQREVQNLQNELQTKSSQQPIEQATPPPSTPEIRPSVEPIASPSLIYAVRMERDPENKIIPLSFDQPTATLILSVPTGTFESYKIELVRNNEPIWQSQVGSTRKEISQLISIHLQRDYLQEGEYLLRIAGQGSGKQTSFPEYRLIVSHPHE